MAIPPVYSCVEVCGAAYYVWDDTWQVVMTADAQRQDGAAGGIAVSVIWKCESVEVGTPEYEAMIQAVRQRVIDGPIKL